MSNKLVFHDSRFEEKVREKLNVWEGDITKEMALTVTEFGCDYFDKEDIETLCKFRNLEELFLGIYDADLSFLGRFIKLKDLSLEYGNHDDILDFNVFKNLTNLEGLFVSGGDVSGMDLVNLELLKSHKKLKKLWLHEFGTVNLEFLKDMPWLEDFFCGYADEVFNVDNIGCLVNLKSLELVDFEVDNLSFLDSLPDTMSLSLCALGVLEGFGECEMEKLKRFKKLDVDEMNPWWKGY